MWVSQDDGLTRCTACGVSFHAGAESCRCASQPSPSSQPSGDKPTAAARTDLADERWCRTQRDRLIALAQQVSPPKPTPKPKGKAKPKKADSADRADCATAAKIFETALKFHRTAMEERVRRGDRDHDQWLVAQHRELQQRGKPH